MFVYSLRAIKSDKWKLWTGLWTKIAAVTFIWAITYKWLHVHAAYAMHSIATQSLAAIIHKTDLNNNLNENIFLPFSSE